MIPFIRTTAIALTIALATHVAPAQAPKRPMTVEDLFAFKRVASPQISPDGKHVVYQLTNVSLKENKSTTAIYIVGTDGDARPKPLTDPEGKKDLNPRWSPDGKWVLFESNRSGSMQLWLVSADGGEPARITNISTGASNGIWSPDGKSIAFVSAVYPEFSEKPFAASDKLNQEKDEAAEKSPVKARTFTKLFFRHWDEYVGGKRQHLFVIEASADRAGGKIAEPRDVTPGDRDAYPTSSTFGTSDDFTFTPDNKHLVFTAVPEKGESWTTNYDLCRVSVTNTSPKWETLTAANLAADGCPKFTPDGRKMVFRAQKKAGYEADKWDLYIVDVNRDGTATGKPRNLTKSVDVSVDEFVLRDDDAGFFAEKSGRSVSFLVRFGGGEPEEVPLASEPGSYSSWTKGGNPGIDGRSAYLKATLGSPPEVFVIGGDPTRNVSHANDSLLAKLELPKPESVEVEVEGGKMQMWVLKPPGFDPKKKWPVVYLVHGGPQGAWTDGWSFRWNPQVWAARGYVMVMPNPRGSTGFGQKFVDEISGDWGGKCYRDLVAGLDYTEKLPYVDKDRIASAGGSFGGYMMDWFAVNEIAPRFKCLITHCSVWNFESMWGTTDELWFDEYEHGGLPWEIPGKYREFSPHAKAGNLAKHKVPMLVIHNDLDFRCPIGQGHELFSALQRQGVPSRFVNFPDEGHWVLKPQNSVYWHKEVFDWLDKYCPPGGK